MFQPGVRWRDLALVFFALVFGAVDQFLGSWSGHPWATDISLLAAPWLALPFVVGCTQRNARRASLLALVCTFVALLAYILMTLSPIENAKVSFVGVLGLLSGQLKWFILGGITSALFGWFGYRWHTSRKLFGTIVLATTFCLEPFMAGHPIGHQIFSPIVKWAEVGVGVAMCVFCLIRRYVTRLRARRIARTTGSSANS